MMVYDHDGIPKSGPIGPVGPAGPTGAPGGPLADGDYTDITVSGGGTVLSIDAQSVTYGQIQNVAAGRLLGRNLTGPGSVEEISLGTNLSFAGTVLNAITPSAALTKTDDTNVTLVLGGTPSTALLAATSLTLGWTGQLAVARGGTGANNLVGYVKGNGASAFTASSSIPYSDLSGAPVRANPSVMVGLTAKNGTANTFTSSDSAPALDLAIAPTWTAPHTFAELTTMLKDLRSRGQARFTGWRNTPSTDADGTGLELGASGASSYVYSYDRTNTVFRDLWIAAATIYLTPNGNNGVKIPTSGSSAVIQLLTASAREAVRDDNDGYLRLNQAGNYTNGVYTPGPLRTANYIYSTSGGANADGSKVYQWAPNTYGTLLVNGATGGYHGVQVYDGTLNPTFMSNASAGGIYVLGDGKWLIYRSGSTTAASNYSLTTAGYDTSSSRELKTETGALSNVADLLRRFRVIRYRRKNAPEREEVGLIAEEVHAIDPCLSDGKTVAYDRVALYLLQFLQDHLLTT